MDKKDKICDECLKQGLKSYICIMNPYIITMEKPKPYYNAQGKCIGLKDQKFSITGYLCSNSHYWTEITK